MVIYRTAQQQTYDIFAFAMSLLFMGLMFSLVKSLAANEFEPDFCHPDINSESVAAPGTAASPP